MKRFLVLFAALVLATAAPARAASASIALSAGSVPALGNSVTFDTTYPKGTHNPSIRINCYQNGTLVWGMIGAPSDSYKLGGDVSPWVTNGGPANCVAEAIEVIWKGGVETINSLASVSFDAAG